MRADNAIRVSLPRGSYESLPVLCDEAVDCRRQPPLISATKMRGGARDEGSTIRVGIGNDVEIPFDTPLVAPRYPAGKVALLLLENGLQCIHDLASSARVIPFGLLDASAVIVRAMRKRALPAIILAYAAGASSSGTVSIMAIDYYHHLTRCHPSSKSTSIFWRTEFLSRDAVAKKRKTSITCLLSHHFLRSDDHLCPSG